MLKYWHKLKIEEAERKAREQIVEELKTKKPVYVPVSDGYPKPYKQRWEDKSYLESVSRLDQNKCLTSELINTLSRMRDIADIAKTPEELLGVNKCIYEIKQLLSVPKRASDAIEMINYQKEMGEN